MTERRVKRGVRWRRYIFQIFQTGRFAQTTERRKMASIGILPDRPAASRRASTSPQHTRPTPRIGSAVVVVDDGKILLGVRDKEPNRGKWVLPGGKVRPFESLAAAAVREIREETGLDVAVTGQIGAYEIIEPPDEHRIIVFSRAAPVGGTLCAGTDLAEVRYFDRMELRTLDVSEVVQRVLEEIGWR